MSSKKIDIGRISYINVAPVYYGLDRMVKPEWLNMVTAPPAVLNRKLEQGEIVLSPVSSAAYAKNHKEWLIVPDLSIASDGKVMSVLLAGSLPIEKMDGKTVILSEESASAAALVKIIFAERKISPDYISSKVISPLEASQKGDAVLIIGDAALTESWEDHFENVYDLGELWKEMTGLPFVFAVWAARRDFAEQEPETLSEIVNLFRKSKAEGKTHYPEIIRAAVETTGLGESVCETYFNCLDCDLEKQHIDGLDAFYKRLFQHEIVEEPVEICFFKP